MNGMNMMNISTIVMNEYVIAMNERGEEMRDWTECANVKNG